MLRREDRHALRMALDLEVEGQRKKGRLKRTWKKQVEEESVKVGLKMEDTLRFKVECWHRQDCCWVEVNLATLTCWRYYQILNIDVSLRQYVGAKYFRGYIPLLTSTKCLKTGDGL